MEVTKKSSKSKSNKNSQITWGIIIVVLIIALGIMYYPKQTSTADVAKCIGQHSMLYVQYGCVHCKNQEDMFGDNVKYLNMVDCYYERDKCANIQATPTWVINGNQTVGVQSLEKLKELTGC